MHAVSIRVIGTAAPAQAADQPKAADAAADKPKATSASGTVTAITGTSLTLKTSAGEATFVVDTKTRVIGTGMGTKAKEDAAVGKKQVLADLVSVGDTVRVSYQDNAGTKQASTVTLTRKAAK
jgi:hypothetical protein